MSKLINFYRHFDPKGRGHPEQPVSPRRLCLPVMTAVWEIVDHSNEMTTP